MKILPEFPAGRMPKDGEEGQAVHEFALILPVLMLVLLGVFDFSRAIYAFSSISNGARTGARFGIFNPLARDADGLFPFDPDTIEGEAVSQTYGLDPQSLTVEVATPSGTDQGDPITVIIHYDFLAATPLIDVIWGGGPLTLRSAATMSIECPSGYCF